MLVLQTNSFLRYLENVKEFLPWRKNVVGHMKYDNIVVRDSIRKLRKSHHMTQMELAEKLDISFTHCSQLKQGCHKMSVDLLFRMMTLFQVDANTILCIRETEEDRNANPFSGIQEQIDSLEQGKREHFLNTCKLMLDGFAVKKESLVR